MDGNNKMSPLLYSFDLNKKQAQIQTEVGHHICSNGLTWSLDGSKFYFTCSTSGEIREYSYEKGTIIGPARVVCKMQEKAIYDGSCIDSEGKIWWACNGANKVVRIDPKTGNVLKTIELDFISPTSVCFGGPDYKTLLVTSMGTMLPGTDKPPNGGVALVNFNDSSIKGVAPSKCIF